ncbi:MAG: hypothetical protein ACRCT1_14340 [Microcoleaceae cyanobacterium]
MLEQFRAIYPTGCLISEFVTVHNGKFVVRSLVLLDGVVVATALGAGDTVESAEDAARARSLSWFGWKGSTSPRTPSEVLSSPPSVSGAPTSVSRRSVPSISTPVSPPPQKDVKPKSVPPLGETPTPKPIYEDTSVTSGTISSPLKEMDSDAWLTASYDSSPEMPTSLESVLSEDPPLKSSLTVETTLPKSVAPEEGLVSQPVDHSDAIAKTDVHLKRLGWNTKQGREFLQTRYGKGKSSRQLLSDEELFDFLQYLESLPDP